MCIVSGEWQGPHTNVPCFLNHSCKKWVAWRDEIRCARHSFVFVIASFCHSASGYNELQLFRVRCCQLCWCYRYSWRLLQWWNVPFWQAYCIDKSFAGGFSTGGLITGSWVDIEFIFKCIGIPAQGLVELLHLSKSMHITTWELLNRFSWNLVLKNLKKWLIY